MDKWLTEARRLAVLYGMASVADKPRRLAEWRRRLAERAAAATVALDGQTRIVPDDWEPPKLED